MYLANQANNWTANKSKDGNIAELTEKQGDHLSFYESHINLTTEKEIVEKCLQRNKCQNRR